MHSNCDLHQYNNTLQVLQPSQATTFDSVVLTKKVDYSDGQPTSQLIDVFTVKKKP